VNLVRFEHFCPAQSILVIRIPAIDDDVISLQQRHQSVDGFIHRFSRWDHQPDDTLRLQLANQILH
jgi:hypothetical protein